MTIDSIGNNVHIAIPIFELTISYNTIAISRNI